MPKQNICKIIALPVNSWQIRMVLHCENQFAATNCGDVNENATVSRH